MKENAVIGPWCIEFTWHGFDEGDELTRARVSGGGSKGPDRADGTLP